MRSKLEIQWWIKAIPFMNPLRCRVIIDEKALKNISHIRKVFKLTEILRLQVVYVCMYEKNQRKHFQPQFSTSFVTTPDLRALSTGKSSQILKSN